MFRTRLTFDARPFEELKRFNRFLVDYNAVVGELMGDTFQSVRAPFLDDLRYYPPVPPGSRYRRTYRLKRGWDVRLVNTSGRYEILVVSTTSYTKWVVGSFDQRRNYQTAVHRRNGWPLVENTVKFWYAAAIDDFGKRFDRYLAGYGVLSIKRRNR